MLTQGKIRPTFFQRAVHSDTIVAKDVYGYIIITAIAVAIAATGVFVIYRESKKEPEYRNPTYIILGICIASGGSLLMVLTILFLTTRS